MTLILLCKEYGRKNLSPESVTVKAWGQFLKSIPLKHDLVLSAHDLTSGKFFLAKYIL